MELRCALVIRAPVCSVLCVSEHRALCLRAPCSVSQSTVLCVSEHCALGLRALCSGSQTTMLCVSEIIHYSLHVCSREVKNSLFPSDTLIYGISRDGSKNYNIHTWEHMTRGQFRLWARATINVALHYRCGENWNFSMFRRISDFSHNRCGEIRNFAKFGGISKFYTWQMWRNLKFTLFWVVKSVLWHFTLFFA